MSGIRLWTEQYEARSQGQPSIGKPLMSDRQRIRQLERENLQLRSGLEVVNKQRRSLPAILSELQLVEGLQTKAVPIAQTCRLLGVSRAGFYETRHRAARPVLSNASVLLRAEFMSSAQSYGSCRIVVALPNSDLRVGAQGTQADATGEPEAGLEARVHSHNRQRVCPAGCAKCACQAVQPNNAELCLGFGYHVHPH